MKKKSLLPVLLMFISSIVLSSTPGERQYVHVKKTVGSAPDVVEFFSFYCAPCYLFVSQYPVSEAINQRLPAGKRVEKYHISMMGKSGPLLTEAWAIAIANGITGTVEEPLFAAVQQNRNLSRGDIKKIFSGAGITPKEYENAQHSMMVKSIIARQESLAEQLNVSSTPSFYIRGQYQIINGSVSGQTPEEYVACYADLVLALLNKSP